MVVFPLLPACLFSGGISAVCTCKRAAAARSSMAPHWPGLPTHTFSPLALCAQCSAGAHHCRRSSVQCRPKRSAAAHVAHVAQYLPSPALPSCMPASSTHSIIHSLNHSYAPLTHSMRPAGLTPSVAGAHSFGRSPRSTLIIIADGGPLHTLHTHACMHAPSAPGGRAPP